jgi:RNA polymerase sigma-70 factor (ECF subfamily)
MLATTMPAGVPGLPGGLVANERTSTPDEYVANAHLAHAGMTYAVAMRATRDPELAADVTQEAFLRLLIEARAGRRPDSAGAWLYRAVTNLVISRARRAEVARRLAPRLADVGMPDQPDTVAVRREGHAELLLALSRLSSVERTALILAAGGASGVEIAAHLGRTHGATRALLCRARARLRARPADLHRWAA